MLSQILLHVASRRYSPTCRPALCFERRPLHSGGVRDLSAFFSQGKEFGVVAAAAGSRARVFAPAASDRPNNCRGGGTVPSLKIIRVGRSDLPTGIQLDFDTRPIHTSASFFRLTR